MDITIRGNLPGGNRAGIFGWRRTVVPGASKRGANACAFVLAAIAVLVVCPVLAASSSDGYYTDAQARQGRQVFKSNCAQCHGANLQGQAGPALAGKKFEDSLEYSKMSAKQLFSFMSSQMPYNDPGSLKKEQYIHVLAYILKKNGYPAGKTALSQSNLDRVKLLPYPQGKHSKSTDSDSESTRK